MTLSQTLKAIVIGFLFGVGLTWLLAVIIPLTLGLNAAKFIHDCSEDIAPMSLLTGSICGFLWLIFSAAGRKRRKREELEDAMTEYFRKQNEKDS